MGRPSSLISHPNIAQIHAAMASATPVAIISKDYGVSMSALYRYKSSQFGRLTTQGDAERSRVLDYVMVLSDSLRDADSVRRQGIATNNANLVLKASTVIDHLAKTLALRLGVDGSNTASLLADGDAVVDALLQVIRDMPGVAPELVKNLRAQGQFELAGEFEDFSRSLDNTKKVSS